MGMRLIQLAAADPELSFAAAIERSDHPEQGADAGTLAGAGHLGVALSNQMPEGIDVAIDFTAPAAALPFAARCAERGVALVVGTTGFESEQREELLTHSRRIPLLVSANFSKAVNLLFYLCGQAARVIGRDADIEIVERHHHFKKDAPSGTALRIADVIAQEIGVGPAAYVYGREGQTGERPKQQIGLHALRTGDNPGEHTAVFGLMGECLELSHRALNRDGFARGALDAAKFLAGKSPRHYTMNDLLGFS
jgi:4-hydroxy-tetrahydrodipicolinate reductase